MDHAGMINSLRDSRMIDVLRHKSVSVSGLPELVVNIDIARNM